MKKTMMYLPEDLHRFLVRESADRGVSMAEIAREAIGQYRADREEQTHHGVRAIFGVLTDDDEATDLALTIDDTLAEYYDEAGGFEAGD